MKRLAFFAVCILLLSGTTSVAQVPSDETQFQQLADRYHQMLMRKPRKGTAFDLVYRHYLDAGKLDDLVARYEQQAAETPKEVSPRIVLGLLYERRGRIEDALETAQAAVELAPDDFYPSYLVGMLYSRQRRYDLAVQSLEQAKQRRPDRNHLLEICKTLGRLQLWQDNKEAALEAWSELVDAFPDDRFVLQELAELLAEEEQFDEAIRRYKQLGELSTDDLYTRLTVQVEIGQIQVRQGKLQTAIETFERCLDQVRPDSWNAEDIRRRIEEIFIRADDLTGLAQYYRERLKSHPEDLAAMTRLADTLVKMGQDDEALEQYRAALELAPRRTDIREDLIDELTRREQYAAAIKETETLLEHAPGNVDHLMRLGGLYLKESGSDRAEAEAKAMQVWQRIADGKPEDPMAAIRAAELCRNAAKIGSRLSTFAEPDKYREQADTDLGKAALAYYEEAVDRAPDVPQYREYLGEFLFAVGRVDDALAAWAKIAEPPNDSVENFKRLAQVYAGADQLPQAVEAVRQAIERESDRYDLHELAADLLVRQESYDEAIVHLDRLEALADNSFLLEQALRRRVEAYNSAHRLEEEAARLSGQLESGTASVRDHWLAAMIAAADRRSTTALGHMEKALALQPDDPVLLHFKAEIHRQGGDLAGAAQQYRQLADLEPPKRSTHLKAVAELELELGQLEAARKTAEEMVRLAPGNIELVQLLAHIHFRAGQDEDGLETLRRALHANPRDTEIRQLLAQRLIERQQIDEAIEHLWRSFELTDDQEGRLAVIGKLADQYAIVGRSEELIQRLERLRREQEDPFSTTLYLVEAYSRGEDYVSARRELNALLARRPDDVLVLAHLVNLSERLGDLESAVEYQEQVVAGLRNSDTLNRLATLCSDAGKKEEAREIWLDLAEEFTDEKSLLLSIDRATRNRDFEQVLALAEPQWQERPDDWRFGFRAALALWHLKQPERAGEICREIAALLPSGKYEKEETPSTGPQSPAQSMYRQYPAVMMRVTGPQQIRAMLSSGGSSGYGFGGSWQPRELIDAQMASSLMLAEVARVEKRRDEHLEELHDRAESELSAVRQLAWIYLSEENAEKLQPVLSQWISRSPAEAEPRLAQYIMPFMMARGPEGLAGDDDLVNRMKEHYEWFTENRPALGRFLGGPQVQFLVSVGRKEEATEVARKAISDATTAMELMQISSAFYQLDDSELLADLIAKAEQLQSSSTGFGMGTSMLESLLQRHVQMTVQKEDWDKLLSAFDRYMTATHPRAIRPRQVTAGGSAHAASSGYRASPYSSGPNRSVGFPAPTAWLNQGRLQMLQTLHTAFRKRGETEKLDQHIEKRISETEGVARQCWSLSRAILVWLENDREAAVAKLLEFADQAPGNIEIRVLLARAYQQMGEYEDGLAALKDAHVQFGNAAKSLEQLRMELAQGAGDEETAKRAALRLFGMRLSSSEQTELAKAMQRWGLVTRSEELMKRAVQTASNKPSELYQLMQQNAAGDLDRAAEIARMIVRQVRRSSQRNASGNNYRLQALQILQRVGELDPLIEKAESQLAAAPQSVKLMEDLAEYYSAAGRDQKAAEMTDRILEVRPDDADLHFRIAQSLFKQRKYEEGIERLAVVWEKDPELMLRNGYQLSQHYAKVNKLDVLAEHVLKAKDHPSLIQHGHYVDNIVQNLQHQTSDVDGVVKVYRATIEIMPEDRKPEIIRQFGQYLINKKRSKEAYALYKSQLLPRKDEEPTSSVPQAASGIYYVNDSLVTSSISLINLAKKIGKSDELRQEIETAIEKSPDWKNFGQLLLAIMDRRDGKEATLEAIGKRYLEDKEFAGSLSQHYSTLREELSQCETTAALRVAIQVWEKGQSKRPGVVYYSGSNADDIRVAAIYMKLDEPEKARQRLLDAIEIKMPMGHSPSSAAEQTIQRQLPVADALSKHGFKLDALAVYAKALEAVSQTDSNSYVRRQRAPQAAISMQRCVSELVDEESEAIVQQLTEELGKKEPDLDRFFAAWDPLEKPGADDPFGPSRRTPTGSQLDASAERQLLPAILQKVAGEGGLEEFRSRVQDRLGGAGAESDRLAEQLRALDILATLCGEAPEEAAKPLTEWLERADEKEVLATLDETWLLALSALGREPTEKLGQELAVAVARSAARQGKTGRQKAAIAAVTRSGGNTQSVMEEILEGRKGDPRVRFQVAQAHFQNQQYSKAVDNLEIVWRQAPDLILPQVREIADYYWKADRPDALVEGIRSVNDTNLRSRYVHEVTRLLNELPKQSKHAQHAVDLYRASVDFNPSQGSSYQDSQLVSYLSALPRNETALDAYLRVVFPDDTYDGRLGSFARPLADLAQSTKLIEKVRTKCQEAGEKYPQWQAKGELLTAMLDRRAGNEETFVKLARKYQSDPSFAARLTDDLNQLRTELTQCKERPALELALSIYQPLATNENGGNTSTTTRIADLMARLDDKHGARRVLLDRLAKPFMIDGSYDEDYIAQRKIQEKQFLAQALTQHGFNVDALNAYGQALSVDTSRVDQNSGVASSQNSVRTAALNLMEKLAKNEIDESLDRLVTALAEDEPARKAGAFLIVVDQPRVDNATPSDQPAKPDSLLPALLAHAKKTERLESLREAVASARERADDDHRLVALSALAALAADDAARALEDIELLRKQLAEAPEYADDATWLTAREAMKVEATRQAAHSLAETVVARAGEAKDFLRQETAMTALAASLTASGQPERAEELVRTLVGGKDTSPQAKLQMARVCFRQGQNDLAVATLEPVWKSRPDLLVASFAELAKYYSQAKAIDKLTKCLTEVKDEDLRNQQQHQIINAVQNFSRNSKAVDDVIALYRAAVGFAPSGGDEYARRSLADYLYQKDRKQEAWDEYCSAVVPPMGPENRLSNSVTRWLDITVELEKGEALEEACRKAAETHPAWKGCADLVIAMLALRSDKDDGPMLELVQRYRSDDEFAESLKGSAYLVRSEFAGLDAKPALELAAELWRTEIDQLRSQQYGGSSEYRNFAIYADVLVKLGRAEEARKILWEAVETAMPGYDASYRQYHMFQRREHVAPKLLEAGYPLDALALFAENLALEGTEIAKRYNIARRLPQQRKAMRDAVLRVLPDRMDETLDLLLDEIAANPPHLGRFFTVVTPEWSSAELARIPEGLRSGSASQTQLLPALLRHAHEEGRLDAIAEAVAKALSSRPENKLLAALETFVRQEKDDTDDGEMLDRLLDLSRSSTSNLQSLAILSLGQTSSEGATEAILAAATDQQRKLLAAQALGRQNTPRAARALGEWLRGPGQGESSQTHASSDPFSSGPAGPVTVTNEAVRTQAHQALLRMTVPEAREILRYETVLRDDFESAASIDWQIQNPLPDRVSYTKRPGMLSITTDNGGFNTNAQKNFFALPNPLPGEDFEMTVCIVGFTPEEPYQQAALMLWNDPGNYLKFSYERGPNEETPRLTVIPNRSGRTSNRADLAMTETPERLWMRLIRIGNQYVYATSSNGETFRHHGTVPWQVEPRNIGLAAIAPGDPAPQEVDISFDFFTLAVARGTAVVSPADKPFIEITQRLNNNPKNGEIWFNRANLYAQRGRWQEAAADYRKGLERAPDNHWHWYTSATVHLYLGDEDEYQRHCREMLDRFREPDQAYVAERVSKICMLAPAPIDTERPARLADLAVEMGGESNINYWFFLAKGIVAYRTGDLGKALEWLEKSRAGIPANQGYCRALDLFYLAMAHHQSGEVEAAKRTYAEARQLADGFAAPARMRAVTGWNDWALMQVAGREAKQVLEQPAAE